MHRSTTPVCTVLSGQTDCQPRCVLILRVLRSLRTAACKTTWYFGVHAMQVEPEWGHVQKLGAKEEKRKKEAQEREKGHILCVHVIGIGTEKRRQRERREERS